MRSQIAPTKSKTNRSNAQVKINDVNSVVELLWLLSMGIGLCYGEGRNLSTKRNHVISRVEREVTRFQQSSCCGNVEVGLLVSGIRRGVERGIIISLRGIQNPPR